MKREYPALPILNSEYGQNKTIPETYQEVILKTLSHFPELKKTRIHFTLEEEGEVSFSTHPAMVTLLSGKRHYTVTILEKADATLEKALLRNLPYEGQVAALAHELAHVLQYEQCGSVRALKTMMRKKEQERAFERSADIMVIEHGLGFELYTYTTYIHSIRGFVDSHHDFDVNRLNPNEILEALPPEQLHEVHRF